MNPEEIPEQLGIEPVSLYNTRAASYMPTGYVDAASSAGLPHNDLIHVTDVLLDRRGRNGWTITVKYTAVARLSSEDLHGICQGYMSMLEKKFGGNRRSLSVDEETRMDFRYLKSTNSGTIRVTLE